METRALGRSNLKLSLVGLGCNNFGTRIDYPSSERVVRRALDLGINHFDTADIYGAGASEEFLGKALGAQRKDIVLATKFGQRKRDQAPVRGGSSTYVRSAVEGSLRRLGTDWIDVLIMHVPDRSTPIEETLRALEDLRLAGKVRYVGASNFKSSQLTEASATAERLEIDGFVGCQDELNVLYRENEKSLLPRMKALGLGLIPYRPLVGGALSGKYHRGVALPKGSRHANAEAGAKRFLDPNWDRIEALRDYAESRGYTLLELAMSWLARQPIVVSIITGATSADQLDANVRSTGWVISDAEMDEINRLATGSRRLLLGRLADLFPRRSASPQQLA